MHLTSLALVFAGTFIASASASSLSDPATYTCATLCAAAVADGTCSSGTDLKCICEDYVLLEQYDACIVNKCGVSEADARAFIEQTCAEATGTSSL